MGAVQLYKDNQGSHRWRVIDNDDDSYSACFDPVPMIHACHAGFPSRHDAIQNLFINHAMMGIFVGSLARGQSDLGAKASGVDVFSCSEGKFRWNIRSDKGLRLGESLHGFRSSMEAIDNLIITYTMLTVFIASIAQERTSDHGSR